ncbi:MAG: hypothetical protein V2B20_13950 [Pseudomonadota bacterium]
MVKTKNILVWIYLLPLGLAMSVRAESPGYEDLFMKIDQDLSCQFRLLAFGMTTGVADTTRNPDNHIMRLPSSTSAGNFRPDCTFNVDRLSLLLQPRFDITWEKWTEGDQEGDDRWRDEAYIYQWLARYRFSDTLYVSYGRENLQWGPSSLTSLSNPFFRDNGKGNPKAEVATTDFARSVWVPNKTWSVSFIANTSPGRMDIADQDFSRSYALKTDYTGSADYGSLIFTTADNGPYQVSGYLGSTVSDALLIYAESVLQHGTTGLYPYRDDANSLGYVMNTTNRSNNEWTGSFLAGTSYTLESNPTLTLEYLHYGPGYNSCESEGFFNLQEHSAEAITQGSAATASAYQQLAKTADPGLRFLRQNYLMLQYVHPDIADVVNLTLRWTQNIDDGSSRMTLIGDWFVGDHLQLFAVGTWDNGRDHSEYGSIIDYQLTMGLMYVF